MFREIKHNISTILIIIVILTLYYTHIPNLNQLTEIIEDSQSKITTLQKELTSLKEKDNEIYSSLFQYPRQPICPTENTPLHISVASLTENILKHKNKLKLLSSLVTQRNQNLQKLPVITPIRRDFLNKDPNLMSGFGNRFHPILHTWIHHDGIDISAPVGSPIYATGAGIIETISHSQYGYGNYVVINHQNDFKTLYAHMDSIAVSLNDTIARFHIIGTVGNTGLSTAPHLHYEIHHKNSPINPAEMMILNLNPPQYEKLRRYMDAENKNF